MSKRRAPAASPKPGRLLNGAASDTGRAAFVELRQQTARETEAARQTTITMLKAVASDPETHLFADRIDALTDTARCLGGRPRSHSTWALVVFGASISIFGSAAAAARNLQDRELWHIVVTAAGPLLAADASDAVRGPQRHHWDYFLSRRVGPHVAGMVEAFAEGAARRAREVGLADPGTASFSRLDRPHCVSMDGKVFTSPIGTREAELVDKQTGEIRKIRRDPSVGQHHEGGDENNVVWGTKFALAATRSPFAGHRVILGVRQVADDGRGEAGAFVDLALDIAARLPGVVAFITDGALRGNAINQIQQTTGTLHVAIPRRGAKTRGGVKIGDNHYASRGLPASRSRDKQFANCGGHDLWAAGGTISERIVTNDGTIHWQLATRVGRTRHRAGPKRWNILAKYRLVCAATGTTHEWHEPLTALLADKHTDFLRAEYLRGVAADDPDFDRVYGMRSDAESLNAQLEHAFHKQRIPALGGNNKTMVLLFAALAQNSWAREVWHREVARQTNAPPHAA